MSNFYRGRDYGRGFLNTLAYQDQIKREQRQNALVDNQLMYNRQRQMQQDQIAQKQATIDRELKQEEFVGKAVNNIYQLPEEQRAGAWKSAVGRFNQIWPDDPVQPELAEYNPKIFQDLAGSFVKQTPTEYEVRQGADGQFYYMPKSPGPSVPSDVKSPQPKAQVEVYTGAVGKGVTKFQETLGAKNADKYQAIQDQALLASEKREGLQLQRATIEQGLETGKLAPLANAVGGYLEGFGIDPTSLNLPDPTKGQIFDAATFKSLLDALAAQKGPQTEGDAQRALKTFASLGNTNQANMFIIDYLEAQTYRQEELADYITERMGSDPEMQNKANAINILVKEYRNKIRNIPIVGKSKTSGIPITYYKYRDAAIKSGIKDEKAIQKNWSSFVKDE